MMPDFYALSTINYTATPNVYTHEYIIFDADGDGDQDLLLASFRSPAQNIGNPIRILLNDGRGAFTDGTSTLFPQGAPLTVHARGFVVRDFNRDGRPDVFIADHGYDAAPFPGAQNTLLLSSGAQGLAGATDRLPQVSDFSHSTTGGDINGDGAPDIIVMNTVGGTPSSDAVTGPYVLVNDGTGRFARHDDLLPSAVASRPFGGKYISTLLFDADGDNDLDLFLGSHGGESATNSSRILYNRGDGNFSAARSVDLPQGPWSPLTAGAVAVTSADVNGDGRLDLIVDLENNYNAHYIQILINTASGAFVDETSTRIPQSTVDDGRWIHSVDVADLNGDGFKDLVARNGQYPPIFLNDGAGRFVNLPGSFLDYRGWGTPFAVNLLPTDANGDSRIDLLADFGNGTITLFMQQDPGPSQTGADGVDALLGDSSDEALFGLGGADIIFAGAGNDTLNGGAGADYLNGGAGIDVAVYSGASTDYTWSKNASGGWTVIDARASSPDGTDTLLRIETLQFSDKLISLPAYLPSAVDGAFANILRSTSDTAANISLARDIADKVDAGILTQTTAVSLIVKAAANSSSVATLSYEFFTGKAPSAAGMDFLVSPTGPNTNNINGPYYQSFSLENRYINFSVNLGKLGEGATAFSATYGPKTLFEATRDAYAKIFGLIPSDAKLHALLDPSFVLNGLTMTRAEYFAYYGQDGANGIGTKAAMVGWLLGEAVKAGVGTYATANDAFLTDVGLHNAPFGVDFVGVYQGVPITG